MSTLERAIEIATEAHSGQLDKAGNEYIGHPLRVMNAGNTLDEKIVGVLHDVVEDTAWTFEMLEAEGFSEEVIAALRCVTKLSDGEPYDKFIARIRTNALATVVKLNDLSDNMDIRRLPYLSDKDVKRLKKYLKAYKQLSGESVYSLYACRQEFPNAYNPWSADDDVRLAQMYSNGGTIDEIAEYFQRKPGAILSRIRKLELRDR